MNSFLVVGLALMLTMVVIVGKWLPILQSGLLTQPYQPNIQLPRILSKGTDKGGLSEGACCGSCQRPMSS